MQVYRLLSPLDHRYYKANRELFDRLRDVLSEEASLGYRVRVEIALLETLIGHLAGSDPQAASTLEGEALEALAKLGAEGLDPEAVYAEEEKTRHDMRALVNVLKSRVPESVRHLVHLGATSYDIRDTALALQMREAYREVVLPLLLDLEGRLIALARAEARTEQIGRTHGQHAVPLTLGFALAEYVSRIGNCVERLETLSRDLRGKLSGAVGAYNATGLLSEDPRSLERSFLDRLGLRPCDHSTQIVEPEYLLRLLLETNVVFGVLANLADDLRNLQRSEIDELREGFAATQVGSSTMPQKRNPWNSEHVKSLWKTFSPRVMTFFMDQVSEHQRDLTNSASSRFLSEYVAGFCAAVARMNKILSGLGVHHEGLRRNLAAGGDMVLAEPLYVLLSMAGDEDAHETVRRLTLEAGERGESLAATLGRHPEIKQRLGDQVSVLEDPTAYTGRAAEVALETTDTFERRMALVRETLAGKGPTGG